MPINQFGVRRSGIHAIAGWILQHRPGKHSNDIGCPPGPAHRGSDLLTFEDTQIHSVCRQIMLTARTHQSIIVMRDPYNWFASRIVKTRPDYRKDDPHGRNWNETRRLLWIAYAHQCLRNTWPAPAFWINFNRWFTDAQYRKAVAVQLGFETDGAPYQRVHHFGNGSSFDGKSYDRRATEMKVLERWKVLRDDATWRKGMTEEVVYFARELFGMPAPW